MVDDMVSCVWAGHLLSLGMAPLLTAIKACDALMYFCIKRFISKENRCIVYMYIIRKVHMYMCIFFKDLHVHVHACMGVGGGGVLCSQASCEAAFLMC